MAKLTKRMKSARAAVQPGKFYGLEEALKIVKDNAKAKKEKVDPSVNKDYGVHEALNLLRGLHILRAQAAE